MFDASCNLALRISIHMSHGGRKSRFLCRQRFTNSSDRGAANHIVAVYSRVEGDAREKICLEFRTELLQFFEREAIKFAALFEPITHGHTNLLVGLAEGNSLVNEVGGRCHCVQVTGL